MCYINKLPDEMLDNISEYSNIRCYYCNNIISISNILSDNFIQIGSFTYCNNECLLDYFMQ